MQDPVMTLTDAATMRTSRRNRLAEAWALLQQPVDIAPLILFRIAFGAIMGWEVWRHFTNRWIDRLFPGA